MSEGEGAARRSWHLLDRTTGRGFWSLDWEVKREDCWVGAFWRTFRDEGVWELDVWVCVLPCLPLHCYLVRRHDDAAA
jgi:hypothetical protein